MLNETIKLKIDAYLRNIWQLLCGIRYLHKNVTFALKFKYLNQKTKLNFAFTNILLPGQYRIALAFVIISHLPLKIL